MIGSLAAVLAGLAAVAAVSAVASRGKNSLLAAVTPMSGGRATRPNLLAAVGTMPILRRIPLTERTARRIASAGHPWGAREAVGAQALSVSTAVGPLVAFGLGWVAIPIGMLAWRIPGIWLDRRARRRRADVDREVPVLLDLLAVATSSGLPPQLALRRAVEAAEGPLANELGRVIRATDLGGRWREELASAAASLGSPDLDRTVGTLTRSEALGSSLEEEIARLATDVREARRSAATERARAAPVKMLFPLVFLVLPAFLLLTVVPVLVSTVESIR